MSEKKGMGKRMVGLIIYVCLSATALTLIKLGLEKNSTLLLNKGGFDLQLSWILVGGACLYVVSFCLSLIVMKGMNLSVFYPLSAGMVYIAVCVLSFLVLKEKITTTQLIGMAVILAGIVIMNLNKNS